MNHTSSKYLIIVLATILLNSCSNSLESGTNGYKSSLKFNVNNAKAIAGFSGNASKAFNINRASISRAFSLDELMKIKEDGTLESAITFLENNSNWTPDISFISIGSDKSVYICFSTPFQEWTSDNNGKTTMTAIQFVRIYPDNSYDVLWPLSPSNYNQSTDGVVNN